MKEEIEQKTAELSADHESSGIKEALDPKPSPCSSSISTELDAFLKEISDASESFLQTLHVKIRTSFDASDGNSENNNELDGEEFPMLPQFSNLFPAQNYSDELLGSIQSDFKYLMKHDDDDDMDNEWRRLGAAEENLRKELDFASCGFGLLGRSHLNTDSDACSSDMYSDELCQIDPSLWTNKSLLDDGDADSQHAVEHEASLKSRSKGSEQICQNDCQDEGSESENDNSGDSYVLVQDNKMPQMFASASNNPRTYAFHTSASLTEQACYVGLHRLPCDLGAFSCPIFRPTVFQNRSQHTPLLPTEERIVFRQHFCREFVNMMPSTALRKLFVGLTDVTQKGCNSLHRADHQEAQAQSSPLSACDEEITMLQHSIRTCTIRVRPDILCGSIMDSVAHTISTLDGEILKRQGGHLRAVIPSTYKAMKNLSFRTSSLGGSRTPVKDEMRLLPPWIMDAQVCTRKRSKDCERVLLIRAFHVPRSLQTEIPPSPSSSECGIEIEEQNKINETNSESAAVSCLWDAAHILHDMILDKDIGDGFVTVEKTGEILSTSEAIGATAATPLSHVSRHPGAEKNLSPITPSSASKVARKIGLFLASPLMHLSRKTDAKHSFARAIADHGLFPSLSNTEAPLVEAAWEFIKNCVNELESRDLTYTALATCAFGAFPALSTIDSNYCSQLQLLVRESMVFSLLKTAAELEKFARDEEYSCLNLVQLLQPAFAAYGTDPPKLPRPIPLSAYPLEFIPPEVAFPPWGQSVMEALSVVSSASSPSLVDGKSLKNGFERASKAVSTVVAAFQRQADEEQSARLSRKNMQVMDRLAKMQEHKRSSILAIKRSYGESVAATKAAAEFHAKAEQFASSYDDLNVMSQQLIPPHDEVPLFQCGIFLGGATGTCFITAHQLLCATQLIPLVGGNRYHLFNLRDIELVVTEHPTNSLMQLPPGLSVRTMLESNSGTLQKEIIKFIPSIDAQRFKDLVDAIRDIETEPSDSLKFSTRGGFLYMDDS